MSCKPEGDKQNCKPENEKQSCLEKKAAKAACEAESSGGFFSWIFGGSSSSEDTSSGKCPGGCGMDKCDCNCALRNHLKQCCDFGKLPPLVTKDCCPVPPKKEKECPEPPQCVFLPVETTCKPPNTDDRPAAFACDRDKKEKPKCCMPCTDTSGCIPSWVCPPNITNKQYSAPSGVEILPIYATGRNRRASAGKCGECGVESKVDESAKPKVSNPNCPMLRPRECVSDKDKKNDGGFFSNIIAKISALFNAKK